MSALEVIKKNLNAGGSHLGDLIWWALADARVNRATLEGVWAGAGLDLGALPEPPSAEKALKTAVREAQVGEASRLIRLGKEDEAELIYAVNREDRHEDGSITYVQETRIVFDRNTEAIGADASGHDLVAAVRTRFGELRSTHSSDDIRRAMMNVLNACAAVTLREHGGVYWIPAPHAATLRKLQAAVEKIGSSRVYLLPVHASADANKTLGEAAVAALTDELTALKAEVEAFQNSPPERQSTLVRRLDAFEELRGKAELYRSVLSVTVADLDQTLTVLTASVETLLSAKAAA